MQTVFEQTPDISSGIADREPTRPSLASRVVGELREPGCFRFEHSRDLIGISVAVDHGGGLNQVVADRWSRRLVECQRLFDTERVQRGDPQRKKIALVATGHYLVRVMWAMLKRGTYWQENPALTKPTPAPARQQQEAPVPSVSCRVRRQGPDGLTGRATHGDGETSGREQRRPSMQM